MNSEPDPEHPEATGAAEARQAKRNLRRAVIFGVVMATIEMTALLYFMYC